MLWTMFRSFLLWGYIVISMLNVKKGSKVDSTSNPRFDTLHMPPFLLLLHSKLWMISNLSPYVSSVYLAQGLPNQMESRHPD